MKSTPLLPRSAPSLKAADVVIVGAGPGGAAAASVLASAGAEVVMLERARFPRDKSCGDGVTAHAVDILEEMGVTFASFGDRAVRTLGGRIGGPDGNTFAAAPPAQDGRPVGVLGRASDGARRMRSKLLQFGPAPRLYRART